MKKLLISGTSSGVGKTTISLGVMAALTKRGLKVAPFKVGPDYIDPTFHNLATNNFSHNLDSWMMDENILTYLFYKNMKDKDISVIEGVMGLYDGAGGGTEQGSTAHVAKTLKVPTILVLDGQAMSTSAAAIVLGYKLYDKEVDLKGVIVNKVSGKAHYKMIKKAIEEKAKVPCLGYLPSFENVSLKSRHLGLVPAEETEKIEEKIAKVTDLIEEYIDLEALEKIAEVKDELSYAKNPILDYKGIAEGLTIGVAKDKAFSFYYQDNLNLLQELGAKLVYFSPLNDNKIPENVDGLYFGGGFPEVFAAKLKANVQFKQSLKSALQAGTPTYAECGGLMYLTEGIEDLQGNFHEMVGFFNTKSKMTKSLQRFGYVDVEVSTKPNLVIKGHEFHRSLIEDREGLNYFYNVVKSKGGDCKSWRCGLVRKNTLAGYTHLHFYSNLAFLKFLLERVNSIKGEKV
ncbi:cobyrinate a,c-diamide synthase [Proteinivorax hydrogeniformans]|uniref:Cobyrinate a,c-diamide synthase n=1 Tax=Proteinivorax hydrogeniformans TaxID=1826727 RepID=A0AAU8HV81_9FIRM